MKAIKEKVIYVLYIFSAKLNKITFLQGLKITI